MGSINLSKELARSLRWVHFLFSHFFYFVMISEVLASDVAPDEIVIASTSDFHAHLSRSEAVASVILALRDRFKEKFLYLDAGDLFQGELEGNRSKGKSVVDFFNEIHLDAAAIGNHDLDYGPEAPIRIFPSKGEDPQGNLRKRIGEAKFQWLSANWISNSKLKISREKNALGDSTVFKPHAIFVRGNLRIGVIGATTPTTSTLQNPHLLQETRFAPLNRVVEAEARYLKRIQNCDFVILLAHAGLGEPDEISPLLENIPSGLLDAVIAGHTHLKKAEFVARIPVVEPGSYAQTVGLLHLYKNRREAPRIDPFIEVPNDGKVSQVTELLKPIREQIRLLKLQTAGTTDQVFEKTFESENKLGHLVADALLAKANKLARADFALLPSGLLKQNLPAGKISYGDIYASFPSDYTLSVVRIKGIDLRRFIEIALSGAHGVPAISGFKIKCIKDVGLTKQERDLNGDGQNELWERNRVEEIFEKSGLPLDDEKFYRLATIDLLFNGGDHEYAVFDIARSASLENTPPTLVRDLIFDFVKEREFIRSKDFTAPRILGL